MDKVDSRVLNAVYDALIKAQFEYNNHINNPETGKRNCLGESNECHLVTWTWWSAQELYEHTKKQVFG